MLLGEKGQRCDRADRHRVAIHVLLGDDRATKPLGDVVENAAEKPCALGKKSNGPEYRIKPCAFGVIIGNEREIQVLSSHTPLGERASHVRGALYGKPLCPWVERAPRAALSSVPCALRAEEQPRQSSHVSLVPLDERATTSSGIFDPPFALGMKGTQRNPFQCKCP